MFDLVLKNGTVITEQGVLHADIAIHGERIAGVFNGESGIDAKETIDVSGKIVTPGGIDPHVHIPDEPGHHRGDFSTEGKAALFGGNTTIIEFLKSDKKESLVENFHSKKRRVDDHVPLDYAFHAVIYHSWDIDAIEELYDLGIYSFKHIMADCNGMTGLQTGFQLRSFEKIHNVGGMAIVHAESDEIQSYIKKEMMEAGRKKPIDHAESRTIISEVEAISRSILLAEETGIPLHVFHVTSKKGTQKIEEASEKGLPVTGETCPHYLFFTRDNVHEYGPYLQINPALKYESDRRYLRKSIEEGGLSMVSSDHYAPLKWEKEPGWDDCWSIEGGVPGIETRLPLLIGEIVGKNIITWERFASLSSTEPAKVFNLYPRKGVIRVGADADITVWDPDAEKELELKDLHQTADWTPYEKLRSNRGPEMVFLRGKMLIKEKDFLGEEGYGSYLPRT